MNVFASLQIHKDLTCIDYQNQTVGLWTTVGLLSNITAIAIEVLRPKLVSLH